MNALKKYWNILRRVGIYYVISCFGRVRRTLFLISLMDLNLPMRPFCFLPQDFVRSIRSRPGEFECCCSVLLLQNVLLSCLLSSFDFLKRDKKTPPFQFYFSALGKRNELREGFRVDPCRNTDACRIVLTTI